MDCYPELNPGLVRLVVIGQARYNRNTLYLTWEIDWS